MKILFVSPVFPLPPDTGTKVRLYNLMAQLRRQGHELGLVAMAHAEDLAHVDHIRHWFRDLEIVPIRRKGEGRPRVSAAPCKRLLRVARLMLGGAPPMLALAYHPRVERAIARLEPDYDAISVEFFYMGLNVPRAVFSRAARKLLLVEHDISFIPKKRQLQVARGLAKIPALLDYLGWRRLEMAMLRRFPRTAVMSEVDRQRLAALVPGKEILILPNGADMAGIPFTPRQADTGQRPMLLFVGGLRHEANLDGLRHFLEHTWPLLRQAVPDITLVAAGDAAGRESELLALAPRGVEFPGFVDDLGPLFAACAAFIAPLRIGGGTRLKLLQAMAAGAPVIATSVGAEGLDAAHGTHLLLADTPQATTQAVLDLLRSPPLGRDLALAARRLCEERYDWKQVAMTMEHALSHQPETP